MKTLMMSLPLLLLAVACDNPQRNRLMNNSAANNLVGPNNGATTGTSIGGATGGSTTGSTTGGTVETPKQPGFESCSLANRQSLGQNSIGVCQSTQDESSVIIYTSVAESSRICIIPTYKDYNGASTYLGQPQCFLPQANKAIMGSLYKSRSGYASTPINGVMVMKEPSLGAYYTCMDSYANYIRSACPQYLTAQCDTMARAVRDESCNSFKGIHSYLDLRLK